MNTSHNKNRIITHGWTNVLKNLFGVSKKSIDPEDNKANNGIPQGKNQNTEPSGSTEMKEREEVSIQRNVKTNSSTINITDIEEKSEKVPNHDDKAKVSDARNILDSRIRKNNNNDICINLLSKVCTIIASIVVEHRCRVRFETSSGIPRICI